MTWSEAQKAISDKNAEIEQLKSKNEALQKWILMTDEEQVLELKAEIERLRKLITELCDALAEYHQDYDEPSFAIDNLIQRAREAAK